MEHNDDSRDRWLLLPELENVFDRLKRLGRSALGLSPIETAHLDTPEEYMDMIANAHRVPQGALDDYFHSQYWGLEQEQEVLASEERLATEEELKQLRRTDET